MGCGARNRTATRRHHRRVDSCGVAQDRRRRGEQPLLVSPRGKHGALSRSTPDRTCGNSSPADGAVLIKGSRRGWCPATLRTNGGRGGIRTHGRIAPTPDFESGAFNHSATLPAVVLCIVPRLSTPSPHTQLACNRSGRTAAGRQRRCFLYITARGRRASSGCTAAGPSAPAGHS